MGVPTERFQGNRMSVTIDIKGYSVIVDDEDYNKVVAIRWTASKIAKDRPQPYFRCFARINGRLKIKWHLHRWLIDAPVDKYVDHINHNTLDNRKCNLRLCTMEENMRNRPKYASNTTGYRGIAYHKRDKRYQAQIKVDGKRIYLGYFLTAEEAFEAYKTASQKYHGEFGCIE